MMSEDSWPSSVSCKNEMQHQMIVDLHLKQQQQKQLKNNNNNKKKPFYHISIFL